MQNTIKAIAQMIQNSTPEKSTLHECAEIIATIAQENDREEAINKIATLAITIRERDRDTKTHTPESDERTAAIHLCHAIIGLLKFGEASAAFMEQWAINEIEDIKSTPVQRVKTGDAEYERVYTEDLSDNYRGSHHLIDLYTQKGRGNLQLAISQFANGRGASGSIRLDNNEVDELTAVLLQQRLGEAEQDWQASEEYRKAHPTPSDEFDPFEEELP